MSKYRFHEGLFAAISHRNFPRLFRKFLSERKSEGDLVRKGIPHTLWGTPLLSPVARGKKIPVNATSKKVFLRVSSRDHLLPSGMMLLERLIERSAFTEGKFGGSMPYGELVRRFGEANHRELLSTLSSYKVTVYADGRERCFGIFDDHGIEDDIFYYTLSDEIAFFMLFDFLVPFGEAYDRIQEYQEVKEHLIPEDIFGVEYPMYRSAPIFWMLRAALTVPKVIRKDSYFIRQSVSCTTLETLCGRALDINVHLKNRMEFARLAREIGGESGRKVFGFTINPVTLDSVSYSYEELMKERPIPPIGKVSILHEAKEGGEAKSSPLASDSKEKASPAPQEEEAPTEEKWSVPSRIFLATKKIRVPAKKIPGFWREFALKEGMDEVLDEGDFDYQSILRKWFEYLAARGYKCDEPNRGGWWNIRMDSKMERIAEGVSHGELDGEALAEEFRRFQTWQAEKENVSSNWHVNWKNWAAKAGSRLARKSAASVDWGSPFVEIAREEGLDESEAYDSFRLFLAKQKSRNASYADWGEAWRSWLLMGKKFKKERAQENAGRRIRSRIETQYYLAKLVSEDIVRMLRAQGVSPVDVISGRIEVPGVSFENYTIPPGLGKGQETLFFWSDPADQAAAIRVYAQEDELPDGAVTAKLHSGASPGNSNMLTGSKK